MPLIWSWALWIYKQEYIFFPQTDLATTIFITQYLLMYYGIRLGNTPPDD